MAEEDKKEDLEPQDEPEKDSGDASAPIEPEKPDGATKKAGMKKRVMMMKRKMAKSTLQKIPKDNVPI